MDIWIIRNGEKIGPIHDFEVRRQIANGELPATTPAWHEGLPEWKPLVEIDLFTREFELPSTPEPSPLASDDSSETNFTPPPLTAQTHYGRRFWARWLDLTLYSGVWWIGMWAAGQNIEAALINPWVMIFQYVPWFILEALLLHQFRTTPGKWLLGLQVVNKDGSTLSLAASSRRSMRVLFSGIGFGWSILALLCQALSWFMAKRLGNTVWDQTGGHQVTAAPLRSLRIVALFVLFMGALQLQMLVVAPHLVKIAGETYPFLKTEYEKNPHWHLPPRY